MAKSTKQDPTLELGPSSGEDENQGIFLPIPIADMILPPEKEAQLKAEMSEMSAKYTGFVIQSKQDYEQLRIDLKYIADRRILVDGKDGWRVTVKRMADTISGKLLAILEPAEAVLKGIKKAYDDAEAIKAAEAKAKADKLLADRKAEVFALGGKYDGSAYVLGNVEIYPEDLPGDGYILKIEKMRAEKVRLDEVERVRRENEEKERVAEVERQRLAKEAADKLAADNLKKDAEIKALQDQLAALAAAKEKPVVIDEIDLGVPIDTFTGLLGKAAAPVVLGSGNVKETLSGDTLVDALDTLAKSVVAPIAPPAAPTTTDQPAAKVDPPAVTAAPVKFQPMEIDFANDTDLVHAYQSGGYAFAKQARAKFPQISVSDWKALWEEFLSATK